MPLREVAIEVTAANQGETVDADYSGVPVTLTFGATETSKTFSVTAVDDEDVDDGETVLLEFGMLPEGVSTGSPATAVVQIEDNDGVPPGSVRGLTASPGDGQVTLTWRAPAVVGSSPISGYAYRYRVPTGVFTLWAETGSTDTSVVVGPLVGGQEYVFQVRARNEFAWSNREAQVSVTLGQPAGGICDRTRECRRRS